MFDKKLKSRTSKGVLLHTLKLVVRDDQGGQSGQVCEHVGRQHGHLVVAQVQPGEGLEVLQPVTVDGGDLVDVKVELGGLGGDALGDLLQLGVRAPHYRACAEIKIKIQYLLSRLSLYSHYRACAAATWWAVVRSQTAHVVAVWNKTRIMLVNSFWQVMW